MEEFDSRTKIVKFKCPKCNNGDLKPSAAKYLEYDVWKYPHKCDFVDGQGNECGHTEIFSKTYPYLDENR